MLGTLLGILACMGLGTRFGMKPCPKASKRTCRLPLRLRNASGRLCLSFCFPVDAPDAMPRMRCCVGTARRNSDSTLCDRFPRLCAVARCGRAHGIGDRRAKPCCAGKTMEMRKRTLHCALCCVNLCSIVSRCCAGLWHAAAMRHVMAGRGMLGCGTGVRRMGAGRTGTRRMGVRMMFLWAISALRIDTRI